MLCLWIRKLFPMKLSREYIFFLPPCFMMSKRTFFIKLFDQRYQNVSHVKQCFSTDYLFCFVLLFLKKKWGNYMHIVCL